MMVKIVLAVLVLSLTVTASYAQENKTTSDTTVVIDTLKPYQKYPVLPAFNILEMDSSTIFNTYNIPGGKPIALMLFTPECKHCKRTINALVAGMDSLQNIQFYLVTAAHDMTEIREFYKEHHLADYKNIKMVGRDYEFFYFSYYGAQFVPDIALYDKHKKLIKLIQGETTVSEVYKYAH